MRPTPKTPVKAPTKPETARQVKSSVERSRGFAAGGKTHGFGRGDHTATDGPDAAGPVEPGRTGKPQSATKGPPRATGGPKVANPSLGGLARPAGPGRTGPV
jgi:hypothetical protein